MTTTATLFNFDVDPAWYKQQLAIEKTSRPRGRRRNKNERMLVGFVDGVLVLVFPSLTASVVADGAGEGWFSISQQKLKELLETYSKPVRVAVDRDAIHFDRFRMGHSILGVRLGPDDPEFGLQQAQVEQLAAEQCYERLVLTREAEKRRKEKLSWTRAGPASNATPLSEIIHSGSLIVFRSPEFPDSASSARAIVDKKAQVGDKLLLLCRDFRGNDITVDPRWVTNVGC
ncbi:MAG: hypothetical protein IT381_32255 [Deltaproteobacteria bacterium]|nr:hypothetical protein [Deltaproteobacteria bacterium]